MSSWSALQADTLVSIVIVHHNRGAVLHDTILGVLSQTHPAIELVIIDDGSDDEHAIAYLQHAAKALQTCKRLRRFQLIMSTNRY